MTSEVFSLARRNLIRSGILFLAVTAVLLLAVAANQDQALATTAQAGAHGQLVPQQARTDVPVVADGQVLAHAQLGNRVFVAGDFQSVRRPNGTTITQPFIFAYDIDSGAFDEGYRPVVNKAVLSLEVSPAGDALYAGGKFTNWDGAWHLRVAKLDVNGAIDPGFTGSASAVVRSIAATDDQIFLAGDFTNVSGQARVGFAAVNPNTGAADPGFVMNVQNTVRPGQHGRRIVATNDGNTVFGLHFGTQINGQPREGVMKVDVSTPTATLVNWRTDMDVNHPCLGALRDLDISPDDSYIVFVTQGGDRPPNCDSALRYETGGTGVIPFTWSARLYSSVFSVAISDTAVYVGGHFCGAPKNGAPVGGITDPDGAQAGVCIINDPTDPLNPHNINPDGAVFRRQMAALNPTDAKALAWDPGTNANVGVLSMTIIDRGLFVGHDGSVVAGVQTGRSGFLDFGIGADAAPPTLTGVSATVAGSSLTVSGSLTDDVRADEVRVRIRRDDGRWLQPNGTLSTALYEFVQTPGANGAFTLTTSIPDGQYEVTVSGSDFAGKQATPVQSNVSVGGAPGGPGAGECVATAAGGQTQLQWGAFNGENDNYLVRNANGWVATVAANTLTWTGPADTYIIRSREGGQTVNVTCTQDDGGGNPPNPDPGECVATAAGGQTQLQWGAFNGEDDNYLVRNANGWVATVAANTLTWTGPTDTYIIRSREGGQTVNVTCTQDDGGGNPPDPDPDPECSTVVGDSIITLNWDGFNGEDDGYQIRTANGWLATLSPNARTWSFDLRSQEPPLFVRSKEGGNTVSLECTWTAPGARNLALGRPAAQSSDSNVGSQATKAVDGNTNGAAPNISETQLDAEPWWEVDLGAIHRIESVELWNRTDCCADRLANGVLFISDASMNARSVASLEADSDVEAFEFTGVLDTTTLFDVMGVSGRYVRVQLRDSQQLALAEVVVTEALAPNLALNQPASQSSDLSTWTYKAHTAVNGSLDGRARGNAITGLESQPWWEVDLGSVYDLETVRLWNRTDCCSTRLANGVVFISDSPMDGQTLAQLEANPAVDSYSFVEAIDRMGFFDVSGSTGRYVRVQLRDTQNLQLAEVVVTGQ